VSHKAAAGIGTGIDPDSRRCNTILAAGFVFALLIFPQWRHLFQLEALQQDPYSWYP
jgi:hypothetical protein